VVPRLGQDQGRNRPTCTLKTADKGETIKGSVTGSKAGATTNAKASKPTRRIRYV
jgi:hypothetical protein